MKTNRFFFNFHIMLSICLFMLLSACDKDMPEVEPEQEPETDTIADTISVAKLDELSSHLRFVGYTIKEGSTPEAPVSSSLKFNIIDTLRLVEGLEMPLKFLHDKFSNVAGVYIQVSSFVGSTDTVIYASQYYKAPELFDMSESDTVSVIMIGFEPVDLKFPLNFRIKIIPYGPDGQPLDETVVPVVVEEINDGSNSTGPCGLVLPSGEYWKWEHSYILNLDYIHTWINFNAAYPALPDSTSVYRYYYSPEKIWGGNQLIKGCCVDGESDYGATCLIGTPEEVLQHERSLPFTTNYQQAYETFTFSDNGTYHRITMELTDSPAPDESDFCSGIAGVVHENVSLVNYEGNWTITPGVNITVKNIFEQEERTVNYLSLPGTSSTGGGWGNPGGSVIHLSCNQLIMLQPDLEGGNYELWKIYRRVHENGVEYYPMHE